MKKIFFILLFLFINQIANAQDSINFNITSPFKLWLLNNEAKTMSEYGRDTMLLQKSSAPFAILPGMTFNDNKAEEQLWEIHRKIYNFVDEVQNIYNLAKRFGNGKFSVTLKKVRPEIWGYSALKVTGFYYPSTIQNETRKAFFNDLFIVIGLEPSRDKDLSNRLKIAIKSLKDEEFRLAREYMSSFKALYPSERSVVQLEMFIEQGVKKQFALGLTDLIKSAEIVAPQVVINKQKDSQNDDDPLSELEDLAKSSIEDNEEESQSNTPKVAPDPESVSMYDIW